MAAGKAKGRDGGPGGVDQKGLRRASDYGLGDQSCSRKPDLSLHRLVVSVGHRALSELRHLANVLSLREPQFAPLCCEDMQLQPLGEAPARDASTLQLSLNSPGAGQLRGHLSRLHPDGDSLTQGDQKPHCWTLNQWEIFQGKFIFWCYFKPQA